MDINYLFPMCVYAFQRDPLCLDCTQFPRPHHRYSIVVWLVWLVFFNENSLSEIFSVSNNAFWSTVVRLQSIDLSLLFRLTPQYFVLVFPPTKAITFPRNEVGFWGMIRPSFHPVVFQCSFALVMSSFNVDVLRDGYASMYRAASSSILLEVIHRVGRYEDKFIIFIIFFILHVINKMTWLSEVSRKRPLFGKFFEISEQHALLWHM